MTRRDLQILSDDDLVALFNRGNLNRARRELDDPALKPRYAEDDENLIVAWSDAVTCVFPHDRALAEAFCTCPANQLCRHIVRSVLAYQRDHIAPPTKPTNPTNPTSETSQTPGPWDPGLLDDNALQTVFGPVLQEARALVENHLVAELIRAQKPLARLLSLGHTVKFLVPHDLRYAHCDCPQKTKCLHAAVATLAFRLLPTDQTSGIVTTDDESPSQHPVNEHAEAAFTHIARIGLAHTPRESIDRLRNHARTLERDGWIWPADILRDLTNLHDLYLRHDARFAPQDLAQFVGEFLIRKDALQADSVPIPRSFIQGNALNAATTLGQSRLVGLGCTARVHKGYVDLQALMQDTSNGRIIAVAHRFHDRDPDPTPLHDLGSQLLIRGRSLAHFGAGQVIMANASLTPAHTLDLSHANASTYAQNFRWEELAAPGLVDNFGDIATRLKQLPPPSVRSRRIGEDVFICPVANVDNVRFEQKTQRITGRLQSHDGTTAHLSFPYFHRNHDGAERLLNWLVRQPDTLRFVAGTAHSSTQGLTLEPTGLVFTPNSGQSQRVFLQPWVDSLDDHLETASVTLPAQSSPSHLSLFKQDLGATLGTLLLQGLTDFPAWHDIAKHARTAGALDLHGMANALGQLHQHRDEHTLLECLVLNVIFQESP